MQDGASDRDRRRDEGPGGRGRRPRPGLPPDDGERRPGRLAGAGPPLPPAGAAAGGLRQGQQRRGRLRHRPGRRRGRVAGLGPAGGGGAPDPGRPDELSAAGGAGGGAALRPGPAPGPALHRRRGCAVRHRLPRGAAAGGGGGVRPAGPLPPGGGAGGGGGPAQRLRRRHRGGRPRGGAGGCHRHLPPVRRSAAARWSAPTSASGTGGTPDPPQSLRKTQKTDGGASRSAVRFFSYGWGVSRPGRRCGPAHW